MQVTNRKRFRWLRSLFICLVLAGGVGYGGWYWVRPPEETPQFQTAKVTRGELAQIVTSSGQLNPVVKVQVGSQISGNIQKLLVDFNSPVEEGQIIAQLDPSSYQAYVHQAEGYLSSAKASLELARVNYQRYQTLLRSDLVSQSDYDKAMADLHQAEAAVKINEANLERAGVDLARCTVYSPISGIVISRNVDVGQTVAASLSAPTLFFIANDLARMRIEARVAEADIGRIETGQDVKFRVDAFPEQTFSGKVLQVRNAPTNEQNVVTYETIIEVSNRESKLKPGMTANVSIIVARRPDTLRIPNAAFRFRPPASTSRRQSAVVASVAPVADVAAVKSPKKSEDGHKKDKHKSDRTVYVLASPGQAAPQGDNDPQPVQVKTGISDGKFTEVIEGLTEGDAVVVDVSEPVKKATLLSRLFTGVNR